jgi:hypothetical protein
MREVIGVPNRDTVVHRKSGVTCKVDEIAGKALNRHQQEADTAKAELAELKRKLGLAGLDLDNLPEALPGAQADAEAQAKAEAKEVSASSDAETAKKERLARIAAAKQQVNKK